MCLTGMTGEKGLFILQICMKRQYIFYFLITIAYFGLLRFYRLFFRKFKQ